jgi:hypothetical protein
MKKKLISALIFLVIVTAFCAVRDFVIKEIATSITSDTVGAPVHIGGLSLSVIRQSIKITRLKIYNPKGFPPEVMVDIPLIYVSWDVFSSLQGKIHLRDISFDLKEFVHVKNNEKKSNVGSLKIFEKKGSVKLLPIKMDLVQLKVGRVVDKDESVAGPPAVKVYEVGLKTTYRNVTSLEQLAALILAEPLKTAGIRGLSQYGVSLLTGIGAVPVAAAFILAGKDYALAEFNADWGKAFDVSLNILKESGEIKSKDQQTGVIDTEIRGYHVVLKLHKLSWFKTQITISARKYMLPQPEMAAGIMYRISERLK